MTVKIAERIQNLPPYVFASLNKKIAERRARGEKVINFGMGDPDRPMPDTLVDALCTAAHDPRTHGYPNFFGLPELRRAIAQWYGTRFDLELDPDTEVLPLVGSKEGIAHAALAFCDPGDYALVPNPGYPVYHYGTLFANGRIAEMPLREENGFLPDFEALDPSICHQSTVLWLNYPNNPTGAVADLAFFERAVAFAKRYNLAVCHDNPYSEICYDEYQAPSILQVPGARDVAVEFNSLSKTYNMAGMRVGMVVGNPQIIEVMSRIKSNIDSGLPTVLQQTAIAALTGDQRWVYERNAIYQRRRDRLVHALHTAGIPAPLPKGSLYIWGKTPGSLSSAAFAERLLDEVALVVTPGASFGSCGEGYFRLSLTVPDTDVEEAVTRLQKVHF